MRNPRKSSNAKQFILKYTVSIDFLEQNWQKQSHLTICIVHRKDLILLRTANAHNKIVENEYKILNAVHGLF